MQVLFGFPPEPPLSSVGEDKCYTYLDSERQFRRTMFLGVEPDLCLFNALTLAFFSLLIDNTGGVVLLTYLVELVMRRKRVEFGTRSLSRNTLVDDAFLD